MQMEALRTLVKNMETKSKVRKEVLSLRSTMDKEQVTILSDQISKKLLESDWYNAANYLFVYSAIGNEVNLMQFIEVAWKAGKHVFFPKVFGEEMMFYDIFCWNELEEGCFHVMEPKKDVIEKENRSFLYHLKNFDCSTFETKSLMDSPSLVVLTPGVVFSETGARIGYGKGYYDKFYAWLDTKQIPYQTIGIAFELQILNSFENDPYDKNMNYIYTEKREVKCNV